MRSRLNDSGNNHKLKFLQVNRKSSKVIKLNSKNDLKIPIMAKSFTMDVLKILNSAHKCPKNPKYYLKNVLNILKRHEKLFLNSCLIGLPVLIMYQHIQRQPSV